MIFTATQPHTLGTEGAKALLFSGGQNDFDTFSYDDASKTFRFTDTFSGVAYSGVITIGGDFVRAEITLPDFLGQRVVAPAIEAFIRSKLAKTLKG